MIYSSASQGNQVTVPQFYYERRRSRRKAVLQKMEVRNTPKDGSTLQGMPAMHESSPQEQTLEKKYSCTSAVQHTSRKHLQLMQHQAATSRCQVQCLHSSGQHTPTLISQYVSISTCYVMVEDQSCHQSEAGHQQSLTHSCPWHIQALRTGKKLATGRGRGREGGEGREGGRG